MTVCLCLCVCLCVCVSVCLCVCVCVCDDDGLAGHTSSELSWAQTSAGYIGVNISSPTEAVKRLSGNYRTYALQLRGLTGGIASAQVCQSNDVGTAAASTRTACTDLSRIDNPSADPEWTTVGWWVQGAKGAESAVPEGTVVVVLPPLELNSVASLEVKLL